MITPEMEEILHYLHHQKGYALFAGFATYLLTGIEPSSDIDVYVSSHSEVLRISDDFSKRDGYHAQVLS